MANETASAWAEHVGSAEMQNGAYAQPRHRELTLYKSPSTASGDGANWASPQEMKQNCAEMMKVNMKAGKFVCKVPDCRLRADATEFSR